MSNISVETDSTNKKRKVDHELDLNQQQDYTNYQELDISKIKDLDKFQKYLYQKESEFNFQIKLIKNLFKEININIAKRCEEKHQGHKWIREKEDCMYGSTFTICQHCRCDYYDRSYTHY
jgi:viroplasmin and RNaseH domain-containing protein